MLENTLSTPFVFDLQLFAGEGEEQAESVSDSDQDYDYFGDDETEELSADDEQADDEGTPGEQAEEGTQEEGQQTEKLYTVYVNGQPKQVTEQELLKGYMQESDYTRKMQEVAEQRKAIQQLLQQQGQPGQQSQQPSPLEIRNSIIAQAQERFRSEAGVAFDPMEESHVLYMNDIQNELRLEYNQRQQQQAQQMQQQQAQQMLATNVQNYTMAFFSGEQNIAQLGDLAEDMWNNDIPPRQKNAILAACQTGNYAALNPFLEQVRQKARGNGKPQFKKVPGNPPAQERAGQGMNPNKKFDVRSIGKMDLKKAASVAAHFNLFD